MLQELPLPCVAVHCTPPVSPGEGNRAVCGAEVGSDGHTAAQQVFKGRPSLTRTKHDGTCNCRGVRAVPTPHPPPASSASISLVSRHLKELGQALNLLLRSGLELTVVLLGRGQALPEHL